MYSSCLFCHADLGRNELIEAFPIGRRLAFDAERGRLWVVCRKCERWNLTPLEERWEAVETCERLYRGTRARVATEHVGLARFADGAGKIELVRIGKPLRPEFAAWRYGDQFGRRRRRYFAYLGAAVAVGGTIGVAGPLMGLVSLGAVSPVFNVLNAARAAYSRRTVVRIPLHEDRPPLTLRRDHLGKARIVNEGDEWHLSLLAVRDRDPSIPWWKFDGRETHVSLSGDDAVRAAGKLLPVYNHRGASRTGVQDAVRMLEAFGTPEGLFRAAAKQGLRQWKTDTWQSSQPGALAKLPVTIRLAMEMAAHEDTERRAMEGELALLEAAWRDAEEIAKIADSL